MSFITRRLAVDAAVFVPSLTILLSSVALVLIAPDRSEQLFRVVQAAIVDSASWFYILTIGLILFVCCVLAFSRYGDIRLGPDNALPDYSMFSWLSMLFAAGVGIGLMFYGVAEPVQHYLAPPVGEPGTAESARGAIRLTMLHWGFNAWAIYAIMALILAYFSYRRGLPLTLRSAFYPLIGDRIHGPLGASIDVFAVVCTTFGISTSLGLGVQQLSAGLNYLFDVPMVSSIQLLLTVGIMSMAAVSVALGLDSGIKRLSEINSFLAITLLCFVLIAGPTALLLGGVLQNFAGYVSGLITTSFNLYVYQPTDWLGGWTIFYWGWWISWAPFVGIFIARVSRGRTIREFLIGVTVMPTIFIAIWMGVFGVSAIELIAGGEAALGDAVVNTPAIGLFRFLDYLPMTQLVSVICLVMIVIFFVTSADSGALVLNMMSAGGADDSPVFQRVLWTVVIALISASLMLKNGLLALQTATIASALPFSLIILGAIYGLFRSLRDESVATSKSPTGFDTDTETDWRARLKALLQEPSDNRVTNFQRDSVKAAMVEFSAELEKNGVQSAVIDQIASDGSVALETTRDGEVEFRYAVTLAPQAVGDVPDSDADPAALPVEGSTSVTDVQLLAGSASYCIWGLTQPQIVGDILAQYELHRRT